MSPDIVRTIVDKAGFTIVKSNIHSLDDKALTESGKNLYYDRDILVLLKLK